MISQLIKKYEAQLKSWESDQRTDDASNKEFHRGRYDTLSSVIQELKKLEDINSGALSLIIKPSYDEESTSISLGDIHLITTTYDEHGSSGQQAIESSLVAMAEALNVQIVYEDPDE